MHTHFSAVSAIQIFLAVVIVGTGWRLVSQHLAASKSPRVQYIGQAMSYQY